MDYYYLKQMEFPNNEIFTKNNELNNELNNDIDNKIDNEIKNGKYFKRCTRIFCWIFKSLIMCLILLLAVIVVISPLIIIIICGLIYVTE